MGYSSDAIFGYTTNLLRSHDLGLFYVLRFDLEPLPHSQTKVAKFESAYNLLIIGLRGFGCETYIEEIMVLESFNVVQLDIGAL